MGQTRFQNYYFFFGEGERERERSGGKAEGESESQVGSTPREEPNGAEKTLEIGEWLFTICVYKINVDYTLVTTNLS